MVLSMMTVNKEIERLTPYKYLDSLDSVRFRTPEAAILEGNHLHAYGDFFLALLMGEGIVIPQNQLVDSLAFIAVASQLIETAQKTNKTMYLNIHVSLFNSTNVFEVASKIIGNVGTKENKYEDRFLLSGWPHLDEDYNRRRKWSDKLSQGQSIPLEPEYASSDEMDFVNKLNIILEYFNSPDGKKKLRPARPNKSIRIEEFHQVASLNERELEELLHNLSGKNARILMDTVSVLNKLGQNIPEIDLRSKLVNALVLPETKSLNPFYFDKVDYPQDVHAAVLAIVDSIYNYASGVGVSANLISHTAKASFHDKETPSFYGLAAWARLTNKSHNNFVLNMPNGLIVPSGIEWNKLVQTKSAMLFLLNKNFHWGVFFEATAEPTWRKSLFSYLKSLQDFRTSNESHAKEAEKIYIEERLRHLDQSKHRIPSEYLNITDRECEIRIKGIDELQIEISSAKETGDERGSSERKNDQFSSTLSAKITGKLSPIPEVSGEIGESFETLASISNEKYGKQSLVLQNTTSIKGKPSQVLKFHELQNYFELNNSNARAIKGIIAAVKESTEK